MEQRTDVLEKTVDDHIDLIGEAHTLHLRDLSAGKDETDDLVEGGSDEGLELDLGLKIALAATARPFCLTSYLMRLKCL